MYVRHCTSAYYIFINVRDSKIILYIFYIGIQNINCNLFLSITYNNHDR